MTTRGGLLALLLGLFLTAGAGAQTPTPGPGDANADGLVDARDAGTVVTQILGLGTAAGNPDCTADGSVNVLDLPCINNLIPTRMLETSPASGEPGVSVNRETILRFSRPLDPATVTAGAIHADFGAQALAAALHLSPDGRTVSLFYSPKLPAASRIRVTVDGNLLEDANGRPVDADGDSLEGGLALVDFDTLPLATVPGTIVCGRVFATELAQGSNSSVNEPLEGVTITVDGAESAMKAVTDATGNFCLDPAPVGTFFVHIDGRTATKDVPAGTYYPYVGKPWESVAGKKVNTMDVFLPLVPAGTLQPVSTAQATTIEFVDSVLAGHPEYEGVSVTVPADSLYADDGKRGGMVGIAPVPPDRMPGPPPPGLEFPVVITVQTDGATNFDKPVPVCFPNLPEPATGNALLPGTRNFLYDFNHDTGNFEPGGPMTVTADGRLICTDPGVGIRAPGWHGSGPIPVGPPPPPTEPVCGAGRADPPCSCNFAARDKCLERERRQFKTDESRGTRNTYLCVFVGCSFGCLGGEIACVGCFVGCTVAGIVDRVDKLDDLEQKKKNCAEDNNCVFRSIGSTLLTQTREDDPTAIEIQRLVDQALELLDPYVVSGQAIPPDVLSRVNDLGKKADEVAGGSAVQYLDALIQQREAEVARLDAEIGEARGNEPLYPVLYMAEIDRGTEVLRLRGKTGPSGQYTLFVPRDGTLSQVVFYDSRTRQVGLAYPHLRADAPHRLPHVLLHPVTAELTDIDLDSLPDIVELVYGTDLRKPDTDGDGVKDGAEADQGTNPLDGIPAQTGIIATASVPGTALDVATLNDVTVVAGGTAGVSIFNIFNGMDPRIVGQVDTPGTATAVALSGPRVAVADGLAGLVVIDISDPPAARIAVRVSLGSFAQAVATAGDLAYVGLQNGEVVLVDLRDGAILDRVNVGARVEDLAVEKDHLYVYTDGLLHSLPLAPAALAVLDSVGTPGPSGINAANGRGRLFVGGSIAYTVHTKGFNTIDVSEPAQMQLIATSNTTQFGWKQIVANGSGLGIATVSPNQAFDGPHNVSLYDLKDPNQTDVFLTQFETPGVARAVALFNGLAYVADHLSGLQVINFLAYDALGVPPTITLATSATAGSAEEGALVRVTASVTDDVQVRNVEFLLDGVTVVTDGSFPFEQFLRAPALASGASFTLRARATDTGGNAALSNEVIVTLTPDVTPPRVSRVLPRPEDIVGSVDRVSAIFFEPVAQATLAGRFELFAAGADGLLGSPDDVAVPGGTLTYDPELSTAFLSFGQDLAPGQYRALVRAGIADLAGNQLAADFTWSFLTFSGSDRDQDGVPDAVEPVLGLDPDNPDTDADSILDGDEDFDSDGLSNSGEVVLGTDPTKSDTDGDGTLDGNEDRDADGILDGDEIRFGTDPFSADPDKDGWPDSAELAAGSDPFDAASQPFLQVIAPPPVTVNLASEGALGLEPNVTVASPPVRVEYQ